MSADPALGALTRRLDRIEKGLTEAHQRLARVVMHGRVSELRKVREDWHVRLEMAQGADGRPVLSPWTPVQPASAGALKIKVKPTVGERMTLVSPSGTVGEGSWAMRAPFHDDHPPPAGDEDIVIERGQARVEMTDQMVRAKVGGAEIEIKGGAINIVADTIHLVGLTSVGVDAKNEVAAPKIITEAGPAPKARAKAG